MSTTNLNASQPAHKSPSPTASDKTIDDEHSPMFLSLQLSLEHPSCVSGPWINTIGDLKTNPRTLPTPPYNDGSFHWVNRQNKLLYMAFPAVLNIDGKFGKIGPYFNLMGDYGVKESNRFNIQKKKLNNFTETLHSCLSKDESHIRTISSHGSFCARCPRGSHRM
jgi:hypothetical protein